MALLARGLLSRAHRSGLPFLLALIFCLSGVSPAAAQSGNLREYEIKAAFLFNFVQFVRWPDSAFAGPDAPLYVGVLGADPFGSTLEETVQGQVVDGHRLLVVRAGRVEDLENCQVIFICRSETDRVPGILAQLNSRPVLTVGEMQGFAADGGDIDFYLSNDKVRFEINPQAARQQGLAISSQLLALGKIANHDGN